MGAGKRLTDQEEGQIKAFTEAGWSQRRIARALGRDKKVVFNHQQKMKSPKRNQKLGRKSVLSDRMMRSLIQKSQTRNYSARELTSVAHTEFKVQIGVRRMQQIISETPYMKYLKMLKAPRMSLENKENRLNWALKYIKNGPDFWDIIVFSDEKRFCLDGPDGNAHYWADTRLERKFFSTRSHGGRGLMVWAGISKRGKTEPVFIDGSLTQKTTLQCCRTT